MPVDRQALASTLQTMVTMIDLPRETDDGALVQHLNRVLDISQDVLRVDGVGLLLLDERDDLRMVGASDSAGAHLERAQQQLNAGPAIDCVRLDTTVMVSDLSDGVGYPALWEWLVAHGQGSAVRAVLSAPVRVEGSVVGTLNALRSEPEQWTDEHAGAVLAYAGIIGVLLRLGARRSDGRIQAPGRLDEDQGGAAWPT